MFGAYDLFAYTPLPWIPILYLWQYRHDPGRFMHPFREKRGRGDWWDVCGYLGLIDPSSLPRPKRSLRSSSVWLITLTAGIIVSLAVPEFSRQLYVLIPGQLVAGEIVLIGMSEAYLGPMPFMKYRERLPEQRLPSRIRHLSEPKGEGYPAMAARPGSPAAATAQSESSQ